MNAGRVGDVDSRVLYARAVFCGLSKGIHLRMDRSEAVILGLPVGGFGLIDETTDIRAVGHTGRRAVVASGEDILIPDDDRPDLCSSTSGTLRHLLSYGHKILIPG